MKLLNRIVTAFKAPFADALAADARLMELALARARAFLALLSLGGLAVDGWGGRGASPLLAVYAAGSLGVLFYLRGDRALTWHVYAGLHGMDIAMASSISVLTVGHTSSPFFLFVLFVLMAATYRWGSIGTMLTALAVLVLLAAEWPVLAVGKTARPATDLLGRALSVVALGSLCGYLEDAERRLQREAAALARIVVKVRSESGLRGTVEAILNEVLTLFAAPGALIAIREVHSGEAYLWTARRGEGGDRPRIDLSPISAERAWIYLAPAADAFRMGRGARSLAMAAAEGPAGGDDDCPAVPEEFTAAHPFERLLCVAVSLGEEGAGRLYVVDPRLDSAADLRLLRNLARQLEPVVQNVFLLRRVRARVGAAERARVARELHDGVIQSLIGLEMQVDVLRRQAIERTSAHAGALTHIQALLRHEIITMRELMEQMKPMDVGPAELIDHLAQVVERFERETGISARMVSNLEEVTLPPRVCSEVARIVQEALINVRRHSGARNVVVGFRRDTSHWVLSIDDDGRGFGFSGRLTHDELDHRRKGPVVIKERVRLAGGELQIESRPDQGSRLEIRLPKVAHA